MVKSGDMLSIEDLMEHLCIDLLGVVPEDQSVVVSTNRGEPIILNDQSRASTAFNNIAHRTLGEQVEFPTFEDMSLWTRIKNMFSSR